MKKEKNMKTKTTAYLILILAIISTLVLGIKLVSNISFGTNEQTLKIEANLEKYINDEETLVQYKIKEEVEHEESNYFPIKNSKTTIQLNQINGKYPYDVKVITASETQIDHEYNQNNGEVIVKTNQKVADEYHIICYYNTNASENEEKDLSIKISSKAELEAEEPITIEAQKDLEAVANQNIGTITSINHKTENIYNGYIKSNQINGTNYNTQYNEKEQIFISKKEAQESLEIKETNTFENEEQELNNEGNLVYKNSKINKQNIQKILGENGTLQILDSEGNTLATINHETKWEENGNYTINYENEPEEITIKTSKIENVGILEIENTKEIKSEMKNSNNIAIKTTNQIIRIDEEEQQYEETNQNKVEIKEAKTNIELNINNPEWTNKQQNEITFDINLKANNSKDNMFKNPKLKIELPKEVEKVILQNSGIFHENGLEIKQTYIETNENGNQQIIIELNGEQNQYSENALELSTDIKISATIILKKDIENTQSNINLNYTNQYTIDGSTEEGNKELPIQIESYKEEQPTFIEQEQNYSIAQENKESIEGLKLEVATTAEETIYEGQYIKYNTKLTNTSNETIENIKIVANIPEGVTYAELEAEYNKTTGKYEYHLNKELKEKQIEIGSLKPGETITKYYEVKTNDLEQNQEQKEITTNIKAYVGDTEVSKYETTNQIKPAEAKIFLGSFLGTGRNHWTYDLLVKSDETKEIEVKLKTPKEFKLQYIIKKEEGLKLDLSKIASITDNVITIKMQTNTEYYIAGYINRLETTTETENSKIELTATAETTLNGATYKSNENRIMYEYESIEVAMTSSNEGEEIKYDEEINYELTVTNKGRTNLTDAKHASIQVNVADFLPENVKPISVTYDNWEQEKIEQENGGYKLTDNFKKQEAITQEIYKSEKDGNKLPDINLYLTIPYGESSKINIKTKAAAVYEKTKVENSATITGELVKEKTSNVVTHTILPLNDQGETTEPTDPSNPDDPNTPTNPDDPNKPTNPDKPSTPENPENPSNSKYSISGVAWIDQNEDGQRQTGEKLLSGIDVMLVNAKDASIVKENIKTDSDGTYRFTDINQGEYVVIFKYDTNTYRVTEYQKNGVSTNANSDATTKELTLNGSNIKVGVIEVSNLQASVSHMDIGLVENKICDFKLDKTINKVTVTTKSGTKQYKYQDEKLAKVEIRAKEIEGATVVIEYKIVVTNEGELPSTIGKVIDYLPEGLTFSSEMNTNWSATGNGQLINTSMSNQKIEPGKSVELTLIATKKMTSNNTGTFTNGAEIGDITNSLGIKDKDSTPANKVKGEDDYGEATIIISVSTGIIVYISIGIILAGLVAVGVVIASRYGILKLGKISLFGVILVTVIISGGMKIYTEAATYAPSSEYFEFDENGGPNGDHFNGAGSTYFYGNTVGAATCDEPGVAAVSGTRTRSNYQPYAYTYKQLIRKDDISINMNKLNEEIEMKTTGTDCIFGPFKFYSSTEGDNGYKVTVTDNTGKDISYTICDSTGNSKNLTGTGNLEFYVKVPVSVCKDGITKVKVFTSRSGVEVWKTTKEGNVLYTHTEGQNVTTDNIFTIEESEEEIPIYNEKEIEWTNIRGAIEIIKVDADNTDKKLAGVKITISSGSDKYTVTTDENGRAYIENIPAKKTYSIVEIETPNYGYKADAKATTNLGSGQILTYTLTNIKHTGNLFLEKKDKDTEKALEGMGFKIKGTEGYIKVKDTNGNTQNKVTGTIYIGDLEYTNNESDATEFITDSSGKLQIFNLLEGNYTVIETSVGDKHYGYEIDDNYITWTVDGNGGSGKEIQVTIKRQKSQNTEPGGSTSKDVANNITVYNERKYIKLSGYVWLDQIDGKTSERNGLFKDTESKNTENGMNLPDTKDLLFNNIEVKVKDKTTNKIVTHEKTGKEMKQLTSKLDLYKDVGNNGNGEYQFIDILKRNLDNYYVEFEYDGLTYTNVVPNINKNNGSKAAEREQDRNQFNENFAIVEGTGRDTGITKDSTGAEKNKLTYTINEAEHEAKLNSQGSYQNVNNEYMVQNSIGNYRITANTEAASFNLKDHYVVGEEELRYINLGLYEREQPDIALVKDIQNVRLAINGYEHTYTYNQRFVNAGEYGGEGFNVGVKFGNKYNNMTYSRPVYKSDYDYINEKEKDKELKAYITYKITMRNQSSNLNVQVNNLSDYYDSRYELIKVGTNLDEKGNVSGDLAHNETSYNQKYTKTTIDNSKNSKIEAQKEQTIYVQFKLSREQVATILKDKDIGEKAEANGLLNNIVEITSYSVFEGEKRYAGIDTDSNPGNATPEQENTYEDDTDKAPALQLEVTDARELAGKVFEDQVVAEEGEDPSKIMTAKIRKGTGAYEEGEKGIQGVEITLTENTGSGKIYKATTDANGDFHISNYIPGDYTLTYTWGDETYTVQNYKGTTYENTRNQTNKKWYRENVENRLQDAIDNYDKEQQAPKGSRLQIDEEIKRNNKDTQGKITRTKMDSVTPTMGLGVEYEDIYTSSSGDKYTYKVQNVDFGIIERAKQEIKLEKRVKTMKATLANGQVIVDLSIDENGNITGQRDNVSYMKPDEYNNGFIKLEMDNELIQGTKLEIEYAIKATNISELDYLSEKFYKYGIIDGKAITIEPTGIIDYLDKNWAFEDSKNPDWKVITDQKELLEKLLSEEVYTNGDSKINEKIILYTEKLKGKNIEPGKAEEVTLKVSKTLASTDEISLDNETEIVETNKPGGAKTESTPGNYIPGTMMNQEADDSMAETTIVTPATGENKNYILPIATGLIAFITVGVGIIIIKKKVM